MAREMGSDARRFWKGLFWLNWGILLAYWLRGSAELFAEGGPAAAIALGRLAGLAGAYMILLQFFFMGRLPFLEGVFGLDKLSRIHSRNGKRGIVLLLIHPLLIVGGSAALSGTGLFAQFASFLTSYDRVVWAAIALCLFLIVVCTSIVIVRSRLRYESWYFVHLLAYLAVFASFWHQIALGHTLLGDRFFYGYWIALYIIVFTSHLAFRVFRPFLLFFRHRFRVARVIRESPAAVSIYITGRDMDRFRIRPGQFMILRFLAKGFVFEAHPFSLSKVPDAGELRITVKEVGDFTKRVKNIPPDTKVVIDGPYGVFTDRFAASPKILLIAGGIGITPVRSLLEEMLRKGKDVVLLYGNKKKDEVVFEEEIESLSREYPTRVIQVLSDEPDYEGEKGRIDREKLERLVPDLAERDVYLCGPVPMMDGLLSILASLGVPEERIHYEKFSLA